MLSIQTWPALGGLMVNLAGTCSASNHPGPPCRPLHVTTIVLSDEIERRGLEACMQGLLRDAGEFWPQLLERALC